jgi:hypothetical protein
MIWWHIIGWGALGVVVLVVAAYGLFLWLALGMSRNSD